jgi:hypothetical protein
MTAPVNRLCYPVVNEVFVDIAAEKAVDFLDSAGLRTHGAPNASDV